MGSPQLWAFSIGLASPGPLRAGPEPFPSAQVPEPGHGRAGRAVGITSWNATNETVVVVEGVI